MNTRARAILLPEDIVTGRTEIGFSEKRWAQIRSKVPIEFSAEDSIQFRALINRCCNRYLTTAKVLERGAINARAIKKAGGKSTAPLDQLERHLRSAARIIGTIENMLDDRPGLLRRYQAQVSAMAEDIATRKAVLRDLKRVTINPKHELVRSLAKTCESFGLKVTATRRVYDVKSNRPTWFQEFVAALNDALLGRQGWGADGGDKRALYSDVLTALRGRKGIPRK